MRTKVKKIKSKSPAVAPNIFEAQKALVVAMLNAAKDEIESCLSAAAVTAAKGDFAALMRSMSTIKATAHKINAEASRFREANEDADDVELVYDDEDGSE